MEYFLSVKGALPSTVCTFFCQIGQIAQSRFMNAVLFLVDLK